MGNKLRVGFLNIMPEAEKYEASVRRLVEGHACPADLVLIRSAGHAYKSSDKAHLEKNYVTFGRALEAGRLDGLIITGAPVGAMEFKDITYWQELTEIMGLARRQITSTMGLCWGGIAVGAYLGLRKTMLDKKLFGVFPARWLDGGHWSADKERADFSCPHSRYAALDEGDVQRAARGGRLRLLAGSPEAGHFIFESADGRFVAHTGHPEYDAERIMFEYRRDQRRGLGLIPSNFNVDAPADTWSGASRGFFGRWLAMLRDKRPV